MLLKISKKMPSITDTARLGNFVKAVFSFPSASNATTELQTEASTEHTSPFCTSMKTEKPQDPSPPRRRKGNEDDEQDNDDTLLTLSQVIDS